MPRTPRASADPAGLGRGPLTRRLPVLWQATPTPPVAEPFAVTDQTTPRRFLLGVVLSARRFTVPAAALGILWQVGEALVPVVMGLAIDRALATGDVAQLALWLAALAAVFLMLSLSYRFASQLTEQATEQVQHRLRVTLSRAVLHVDGPGARQPDGGVVSLMTNDVARTAALGLAVYPIAELAGIVFIAVSLLLISWPLGLVVLAGAPLAVWIMGLLSGRLARDSRVYQTLLADTVGRATDLVAGYRIIKGIHAEDEAARRYRDVSQETLTGAYRNIGLLGRFLVGSTTVSGVFVAVVAALAGWFAVTGRLSIGELIAAVGLAQALLPPMRMLAMNAVPAWASAIASSGRVLDALTAAPPSSVSGTAAEPDPAAPESPDGMARPRPVPVVGLTIPGHGTVTVEPGELVGLHAAERTAAEIVRALHNPHSDDDVVVHLDGASPDHRGLAIYRATVAVSPHHATLFSGTIADNVSFAGDAPLQDEALRTAACEDVLTAAGGLEGDVGEMGNRLSGGQRQRLALARALAADAPVLVLHDPTTAVDSVTEQVIASRLRELRSGRSTVLIASSPALLAICDRVVTVREADESTDGDEAA